MCGDPPPDGPAFVFQAQIAFLQGERKGQENLKKDLVRRIKMLEYALKQERWVSAAPVQPQQHVHDPTGLLEGVRVGPEHLDLRPRTSIPSVLLLLSAILQSARWPGGDWRP